MSTFLPVVNVNCVQTLGRLDHLRGGFSADSPTYRAVAANKATWSLDVGAGLVKVLGSKLDADLRTLALKLAALTVEWHGIDWTVAPTSATKAKAPPTAPSDVDANSEGDVDKTRPITLLAVLVEVCTIEMRMHGDWVFGSDLICSKIRLDCRPCHLRVFTLLLFFTCSCVAILKGVTTLTAPLTLPLPLTLTVDSVATLKGVRRQERCGSDWNRRVDDKLLRYIRGGHCSYGGGARPSCPAAASPSA
jgi:hypothetical protein